MVALERRLGHRFDRPDLLARALTHRSRAHENGDEGGSNERLEFLGDAVLDLLVSERLMERLPAAPEGVLSRARAAAVNTTALAGRALALGLDRRVLLGRGEERTAGRAKESILANVFEAVLGALYLDGGLEVARALVDRELADVLADPASGLSDAKTRLQELLQAQGGAPPTYAIAEQSGPPHAREFRVRVSQGDLVLGEGVGRSKRSAEQEAARAALERIASDPSAAREDPS